MNFEVTLKVNYNNRTEYLPCYSAWSANHIAIGIMRADAAVESIAMTSLETGEILRNYVRSL